MSLKSKYWIYIIAIHIALTILLYLTIENKAIFIASELFIVASLVIGFKIYQLTIKPIELIRSGISAIADNDFSIKYLKSGSIELDELINVYNSMIESLRVEKGTVQAQGYFLEKLINVSPIGMIILNYDDKITMINPAAKALLKLAESDTGSIIEEINNSFFHEITRLKIGETKILSYNGILKYNCSVNEVIHQGFARKFILIEDLSSEILKTEKEAYGKVIRMMAHEINNSIGAINSIIQTVIEFGLDESQVDMKESLQIAKNRNINLSEFVDNFADILRIPSPKLSPINLSELLQNIAALWKSTAAEANINIELELTSNVVVSIDKVLIEQVVNNMIKNSLEAIGSNGIIRISNLSFNQGFELSDNGQGIDPENKSHLFSPFFSTKPAGQGIGLMLIKEILLKHKATFSLATGDDEWTRFMVRF